MNLVNEIEIGKNVPKLVNAVVEIPHGSPVKYEIDFKKGYLRLDRILHASMHYPGNYGFIPQTYDHDGDPLDVIIVCSVPLDPLTVVEIRPIGVMMMKDERGKDPKILAVVVKDPVQEEITDIKDMPKHWMIKIEHFFSEYKSLEKDKWAIIDGFKGKKEAHKIILQCAEAYKKRMKQ